MDADQSSTSSADEAASMRLVDVEIENENIALNLLVSFVNMANKRGAFTLEESAKIWQCIQKFNRSPPSSE
jgi:hypothetical protein